jgi:hypothetical protein
MDWRDGWEAWIRDRLEEWIGGMDWRNGLEEWIR